MILRGQPLTLALVLATTAEPALAVYLPWMVGLVVSQLSPSPLDMPISVKLFALDR